MNEYRAYLEKMKLRDLAAYPLAIPLQKQIDNVLAALEEQRKWYESQVMTDGRNR